MNGFTKPLSSTLGQKIIMSITRLLLISFLMVHLIGNLLLTNLSFGGAQVARTFYARGQKTGQQLL